MVVFKSSSFKDIFADVSYEFWLAISQDAIKMQPITANKFLLKYVFLMQ